MMRCAGNGTNLVDHRKKFARRLKENGLITLRKKNGGQFPICPNGKLIQEQRKGGVGKIVSIGKHKNKQLTFLYLEPFAGPLMSMPWLPA